MTKLDALLFSMDEYNAIKDWSKTNQAQFK